MKLDNHLLWDTWVVDVIKQVDTQISQSTRHNYFQDVAEVKRLLYLSLLFFSNQSASFGTKLQKETVAFFQKLFQLQTVELNNIPILIDLLDPTRSDKILNQLDIKDKFQQLRETDKKSVQLTNLAEEVFTQLVNFENTLLTQQQGQGFQVEKHIFIPSYQTFQVDPSTFSGDWSQQADNILDNQEFKEKYGEKFLYFWNLPRSSQISSNTPIFLLRVIFHQLSLPNNLPTPVMLDEFVSQTVSDRSLSQPEKRSSHYFWANTNPTSRFFCLIRETYQSLMDKKTRITVRRNLENWGLSREFLDNVLTRELSSEEFINSDELKKIVYQYYADLPLSCQADNESWFPANPMLISKDSFGLSELKSQMGPSDSLANLACLKNQVYQIAKPEISRLFGPNMDKGYLSIYYPIQAAEPTTHILPSISVENAEKTENTYWYRENSYAKELYGETSLASGMGSLKTSDFYFNYSGFHLNYSHFGQIAHDIINIVDIFNIFKLSERFPAAQLHNPNLENKTIKLYSPSIYQETAGNLQKMKKVIMDYAKNQIETIVNNDTTLVNLELVNCLSFLVKLQASALVPLQVETVEILSIFDGVASFRYLSNNSLHYDVPLYDIMVKRQDLNQLKRGDQIEVYHYQFSYGLLVLKANGEINLISSSRAENNSHFRHTVSLAYHRLAEFFQIINLTSYLINPLENFPLQLVALNPNSQENPDWLNNCPFSCHYNLVKRLDFEKPVSRQLLEKIMSLYIPLFTSITEQYIEGQTIQVRLNDKENTWISAKLVKIEPELDQASVLLKSKQATPLTIQGLASNLRRVGVGRQTDSLEYLFNTNGFTKTSNYISGFLANLRNWGVAKSEQITLLAKQLYLTKKDTEKIVKTFPVSFPSQSCQVNIIIQRETEINYLVTNCQDYHLAQQSLSYFRNILRVYQSITSPTGELLDPDSVDDTSKRAMITFLNQGITSEPDLEFQALPLEPDITPASESQTESSSLISQHLKNLEDLRQQTETEGSEIGLKTPSEKEDEPEEEGSGEESGSDSGSDSDFEGLFEKESDSDSESDLDDIKSKKDVSEWDEEMETGELGQEVISEELDKPETSSLVESETSSSETDTNQQLKGVPYSSREEQRWWPDRNSLLERINTYIMEKNKSETEIDGKGKKHSYSTECQTHVRQPMMISDQTKQFIDQYLPGSYGQLGQDMTPGSNKININCDRDTEVADNKSCIAIKLENKNWVICPVLSCLHCWISIPPNKLLPNQGNIDKMALFTHVIKDIKQVNRLLDHKMGCRMSLKNWIYHNPTLQDKNIGSQQDLVHEIQSQLTKGRPLELKISCHHFVSSDPTLSTDNWIKCQNCQMDIFHHNVGCPICHRGLQLDNITGEKKKQKAIWEEVTKNNSQWKIYRLGAKNYQLLPCPETISKQNNQLGYEQFWRQPPVTSGMPNRSIIVRKAAQNEMFIYPAFLDTLSPCCFQVTSSNKNYDEFFGRVGKRQSVHSKYILKANKPLPAKRMGQLPPILAEILGSNIPGLVRLGTTPGPDSFLELLTLIKPTGLTLDIIKENLVNTLDENIFRTLSGGSLEVIFSDRDHRISSLQNFLEYTLSTSEKIDYLYLDLFRKLGLPVSIPGKIGELKHLQIMVISLTQETSLIDNTVTERLSIQCGPGLNVLEADVPTLMVLKRNFSNFTSEQVYEPIVYTFGPTSNRPDIMLCRFKLGQKKPLLVDNYQEVYLGEDLLRTFNKVLKKCREYPQGQDQTGEFHFNYRQTCLDALRRSLKNQVISGQYIASGNQTIGVVLDNKQYVPIFPREPLLNLPTVNLRSPEIIMSISDLLKGLETLNSGGDFKCHPKWLVRGQGQGAGDEERYLGILTDNGYYIPCQPTSQKLDDINRELRTRLTNPPTLQSMSYSLEDISKLVDSQLSPSYHLNDYKGLPDIQDTSDILSKLAEKQEKYQIIGVVKTDPPHLLLASGLVVPYSGLSSPEQVAKITDGLTSYNLTKQGYLKEKGQPLLEFPSLSQYEIESTELYSRTAGYLSHRIFRVVYQAHQRLITGIITETGVQLAVKPAPLINMGDRGLSSLPNNLPLIQLPEYHNVKALEKYEDRYPDDRVIGQQIFNLKRIQYKVLRQEIAKYISLNRDLQLFMLDVSDDLALPVGFKKNVVSVILKVLVDLIVNFRGGSKVYEGLVNSVGLNKCVNLNQDLCQKTPHCYWDKQVTNQVLTKRIQFLLTDIFPLLSDPDRLRDKLRQYGLSSEVGADGAGDFNLALVKLTEKIVGLSREMDSQKDGICQLKMTDNFRGEKIDILDDYVDQLAEELVQIKTRSLEILQNKTTGDDRDTIIRDGDEISINKALDEKTDYFLKKISEILNKKFQRNYFSGHVAFQFASNKNNKYFSYVTIKETETPLLATDPTESYLEKPKITQGEPEIEREPEGKPTEIRLGSPLPSNSQIQNPVHLNPEIETNISLTDGRKLLDTRGIKMRYVDLTTDQEQVIKRLIDNLNAPQELTEVKEFTISQPLNYKLLKLV